MSRESAIAQLFNIDAVKNASLALCAMPSDHGKPNWNVSVLCVMPNSVAKGETAIRIRIRRRPITVAHTSPIRLNPGVGPINAQLISLPPRDFLLHLPLLPLLSLLSSALWPHVKTTHSASLFYGSARCCWLNDDPSSQDDQCQRCPAMLGHATLTTPARTWLISGLWRPQRQAIINN